MKYLIGFLVSAVLVASAVAVASDASTFPDSAGGGGAITGAGSCLTDISCAQSITTTGGAVDPISACSGACAASGHSPYLYTEGPAEIDGILYCDGGAVGCTDLSQDLTPQLGGDLDLNGKALTDSTTVQSWISVTDRSKTASDPINIFVCAPDCTAAERTAGVNFVCAAAASNAACALNMKAAWAALAPAGVSFSCIDATCSDAKMYVTMTGTTSEIVSYWWDGGADGTGGTTNSETLSISARAMNVPSNMIFPNGMEMRTDSKPPYYTVDGGALRPQEASGTWLSFLPPISGSCASSEGFGFDFMATCESAENVDFLFATHDTYRGMNFGQIGIFRHGSGRWDTEPRRIYMDGSDDGGTGGAYLASAVPLVWGDATDIAAGINWDLRLTRGAASKLLVSGATTTTAALLYSYPKDIVTADDAGGTHAATTVNPADSNTIILSCNDTQGCTATITETAAAVGMQVVLVGAGTGPHTDIADSAGVIELCADAASVLAPGKTLELIYSGTAWYERPCRS